MKHSILFIVGLFFIRVAFGNINAIDITKISSENNYVSAFTFIKGNQQYYDHWADKWVYDKPKEEFIKKLRNSYNLFAAITIKNTELFLLLGDIAHYLYNLDENSYYQIAVDNYNAAKLNSPNDYRCYWFAGFHFALSAVPDSAVANFLKAQRLLPVNQPADFWEEYALTSTLTNMPSHCLYAMDKARNILGEPGSFEKQLGETVREKIIEPDKTQVYKKEDMWTANPGEKTTFVSRPLGIKILVDSTWQLSVYDYENRQTAFLITPPVLKNSAGKEIHYTIALLMKAANEEEKLEDYVANFIAKYPSKESITFSDKYEKTTAFEIKDKTLYQDIGGAHIYIVGVERAAPEYPGLVLEDPVILHSAISKKTVFYKAPDNKTRFKGRIFYALLLDSCEDINTESLAIFKTFFENQIIIE